MKDKPVTHIRVWSQASGQWSIWFSGCEIKDPEESISLGHFIESYTRPEIAAHLKTLNICPTCAAIGRERAGDES